MEVPLIAWVNNTVGYGLFAERDYAKGEFVTFYGGEKTKGRKTGDYVLFDPISRCSYNAFWEQSPRARGRFINDPDNGAKEENVEARRPHKRNGEGIGFFTTREVEAGEEFLWWYGPGYSRPWKK